LGAGISATYHMLAQSLRIIQPSPSYPTHASMESFAAEKESISYILRPENGWQPDLKDLENKLKENPDIVGILIINPNNPTGAMYSRETLEAMVDLAEKYECMLISDEIYFRMVYKGTEFVHITDIAHNRVPLIVMRGLSKDVPWPGARCGWLEFHNTHLDADFKSYVDSIKKRVLMEVCSVSLPQAILPKIYDHPEFEAWLAEYLTGLSNNIDEITNILKLNPNLRVNPADGAFYMMPTFKEGVLNEHQSLEIKNENLRKFVESKVSEPGISLDKRFVYYLLATTGICVVPASSFFSPYLGFRVTTLTRSKEQLQNTYETLSKAVSDYIDSTNGFFRP
jgi:alanine-synthesizing transaminase